MVYMKENVNDILIFLRELDIVNYSCFNQEKFIITVDVGEDGYKNIELIAEYLEEYRKLNYFLRKVCDY